MHTDSVQCGCLRDGNMKWTQLKVHCATKDLDAVCAVMGMLDNGLQIEDYSDIDENLKTVYGELIDETILNSDKTHGAVSIYIPEERDPGEYLAYLRERFAALGLETRTELCGVAEEDWAESWKQYYHPVKIGTHIVIVPAWQTYAAEPDEVVIRMDPGMAFGSGTHETTRLCAALAERYVRAGQKVLDVGTGSGILAILASKLGAASVDAYDIDPVAVRVAKENTEVNHTPNVATGVSDLLSAVSGSYDLVLANIVADIIVRMAPDVGAHMKPGAHLITSGIIEPQTERVKNALIAGGLRVVDHLSENDWHAFVFEK